MKHIIFSLLVVVGLISCPNLMAQEYDYTKPMGDTLSHNSKILDSLYLGRDVFSLASGLTITQSRLIENAVNSYIEWGGQRKIQGYRIRIFFDNKQSARAKSEEIVKNFSQFYSSIGVYRSYDNPYFKVTVGDLRTRSEALKLLKKLEKEYPSAFIVKESINFPPL